MDDINHFALLNITIPQEKRGKILKYKSLTPEDMRLMHTQDIVLPLIPRQASPSIQTGRRAVRLTVSLGTRVSWTDLKENHHSICLPLRFCLRRKTMSHHEIITIEFPSQSRYHAGTLSADVQSPSLTTEPPHQ